MAVGFVETDGLGILNPGVSRSWGRARADISAVRERERVQSTVRDPLGLGCRHRVPRKSVTSLCHGDRLRTIGFADSEFRNWSGARDLNPGPHGPEIHAVSSTETVFVGFELDWDRRRCRLGRFGAITAGRITTRITT
jgi:hypothetical protein